jgi:hypothetical protein
LPQKQLLVCGFDLGEEALDAVELRTIWNVEDLCDVQFFKQQLRFLGLVDTQIIKEQCIIIATKLER